MRLKRICSSTSDFNHYSNELKERFIQQGYCSQLLTNHIQKIEQLDRTELLKEKSSTTTNEPRIPLLLTYNRFLPNISNIVQRNWSILQINKDLREVFQNAPITAFKRNKNLKELIGGNKIENNRVKKADNTTKQGKCSPCYVNNRTMCCKQVKTTTYFKSLQTNRSFKIHHTVNCTSEYVIYLMECILCSKQYVGKAETAFNIRLNNHRKDVKKANAILACKHFQSPNHNFNQHAKFTIIDKLTNTNKPKEILRQRLIERENFWIEKLDTLHPKGFNQELSK